MNPGVLAAALSLLCLATGSAAAPDPAAAPVALEAFAELPEMESPKLSPDGTRVLAKMAVNGRQVLMVMPLFGDGAPRAMGAHDSVDINWWRWVGNDWIVVGVGSTTKLWGEEVYVTRTLGARADLSKVNRIDWNGSGIRADDLLWAARDGSPHVLVARQTGINSREEMFPEVVDADLSTGKVRRVVPGRENVFDWYADGAGRVRMGYRYNDQSRKHELLYRADGDSAFRTIAVRKRDDAALTVPLVFGANGGAIATSQESGFGAVYEVSLPDLALGKKIHSEDGYDVRGIVSNEADDALDGVLVNDRYARIVWFNPTMQKIQLDIDKAIGARRARIISWNAARTRFLVEVGSPSQAGAIYLYDLSEGVMRRYSWRNQALKNRMLSPVTTIRYPARDGTSIEAVLTLPRGRPAKNLPLIVMPHGGPFARDDERWDWWAQFLAESGYAVIQPNYRGSSGYGAAFEKMAEGEWGLKMQDDLVDAVGWAAKTGYADPKRVCIVGASYGGYAAMRAAERDKGVFRCAVSYAGVSDLGELRRYDGKFLNGNAAGDWLKRHAPDFRTVSPRYNATAFSIPILMVHGKVDKRVPVKQSRLMADALKDAGKPFDYIEQPLADHHFSRQPDRLEFLKALKAFLDKHNPAGATGSS
jgi:dipeptidyl aminopeptidase/acylaminoacyl peptidase